MTSATSSRRARHLCYPVLLLRSQLPNKKTRRIPSERECFRVTVDRFAARVVGTRWSADQKTTCELYTAQVFYFFTTTVIEPPEPIANGALDSKTTTTRCVRF